MIQTDLQAEAEIGILMIVDDNDFDQLLYERIAKRSGLVGQLIQFVDPKAAAEYLIEGSHPMPNLVLLDINMPGMNGFEFLDLMTEQLGQKMCPVIVMLTTSLNPVDYQRANEYDIVRDFLNKPLTREMLQALTKLAA